MLSKKRTWKKTSCCLFTFLKKLSLMLFEFVAESWKNVCSSFFQQCDVSYEEYENNGPLAGLWLNEVF